MPNPLLPLLTIAALAVAACEPVNTSMRMGPDGRPVPTVYRIAPGDAPRIQARMRDGFNAARAQRGLGPVELNDQLTAAAAMHARDMARQSRPWLWSSDLSTPLDRINRVGYRGEFRGEVVAETYDTELETLTAWLEGRETRSIMLDPQKNEIGFAWYQEPSGKLWWVMTMGRATSGPLAGL